MQKIRDITLFVLLALAAYLALREEPDNTKEIEAMKASIDSITAVAQRQDAVLLSIQDSIRTARQLDIEMYNEIKEESRKNWVRYAKTKEHLDDINGRIGSLPEF